MKKFTSILLSIILVLLSSISVYADDDNYTYILQKTKDIYNVKEYENFTYNVGNTNDKKTYRFSWDNGDYDKLNITVDESLYGYYYFLVEPDNNENNTIDKNTAQKIADDFVKKAMNDKMSYFKLDENKTVEYAKQIEFTYVPYIDEYKIESAISYLNMNANVKVDLLSGKVCYFSCRFGYYDFDKIESSNFISKADAKAALFSGDNLEIRYENVYEIDKEAISKPLYRFSDYYVNAKTGSFLSEDRRKKANGEENDTSVVTGGGGGGSAASKSENLTDEEKSEIEKLKNALSIDEAINILNNKFQINLDTKDVKANYYKKDDGYEVYIGCEDVFGAYFDSKKEIKRFSCEEISISGKDNIINYVRGIYPNANIPKDLLNDDDVSNWVDNNKSKMYECYFYNKYNGILDERSYVCLDYDDKYNVKGRMYYANNTINHENMERPLTNDEIFKIADENIGFNIVYVADYDYSVTPYYTFDKNFSIDGATKEVLDFWGYEFEPEDYKSYSDVKGMWYENIANTLISYGYKFDENKFEGSKNVTVADVNEFLNRDLEENEEQEITKYDMAKILVEKMDYEDLAECDIFKIPFNDVNDENIGYVAICKALGIAKGENGVFNGDKVITRAEMASMVYNYILSVYNK
ncbi:MAG: S-layer homology domain-containing protein [Lachnospirales bacterium]